MCLAIPGRVIERDAGFARVSFAGVERQVCLDLLPEVEPGDYVLVHAGFAIQRMEASEAEETLSLIEEAFAATDPVDPEG